MKTAEIKLTTKQNASRTEWFVRLVYWIPLCIVLCILGIIASICWMINALTVLILAKKLEFCDKMLIAYIKYVMNYSAYYLFLTDERPPIFPEGI